MSAVQLTLDTPGLSDVPGLRVGAGAGDIRRKGDYTRLDVALVAGEAPLAAAGAFTKNLVKAAPVTLSQARLAAGGPVLGVVLNSGNANACTGAQGEADALAMAAAAEAAAGAPAGSFLVCSTGRIGRHLPLAAVEAGIAAAGENLGEGEARGRAAAAAILTSDTRPKTATARFAVDGRTVTVAGMAKGAGMIQPDMATMLAVVATDAAAEPAWLREALAGAVRDSFNAITVDGDMSTNDTVLLFATGASGIAAGAGTPAEAPLRAALAAVCGALAEKIVGDGEKITKVVELRVTGAAGPGDAERVARAIGNSLLVKSSWAGEDPNWGRLADAAGYAGASLDPARLAIWYENVPAYAGGQLFEANAPRWREIVRRPRFTIRLDLGVGPDAYRLLATDLTEAYVHFNKSE